MLIEIVERRSPVTNRRSVVYRLKCEACGEIIEGSRCRYLRSRMHFCDNSCRGRYKREHPETWQKAIEALNSPESHAKAKKTIQKKAACGEWRHWLGKKHSEETKRHLSMLASDGRRAGENNGMYGRRHSDEAREKMSETKSCLIAEGRFRAYGTNNRKGWYESSKAGRCFYRSSWELAVMQHLDADDDVCTWSFEKIRIPYRLNNNKRWYVPDFLVTRVNGTRQLIEVKPREFVNADRPRLKAEAAQRWCEENDATYVIVTREVMQGLGIL